MMVTKLEGLENLDLILSLIKRMIFLGESHFSISFERLRSKYSDGNKFGFSKSKKQAYHIQKYDNLRPVCWKCKSQFDFDMKRKKRNSDEKWD